MILHQIESVFCPFKARNFSGLGRTHSPLCVDISISFYAKGNMSYMFYVGQPTISLIACRQPNKSPEIQILGGIHHHLRLLFAMQSTETVAKIGL